MLVNASGPHGRGRVAAVVFAAAAVEKTGCKVSSQPERECVRKSIKRA